MSLSSDFSKQMKKDDHSKPRALGSHDEIAEVTKEQWDYCEKLSWKSVCCQSRHSGELSAPWHELKAGGESIETREGVCAKCGQKANFTKK